MEMVRYCPECDDEFRPDIRTCSDCGGELVLQEEGLGSQAPARLDAAGQPEDPSRPSWRTALDSIPFSDLLPIRTFDALRDLEPAVSAFAGAELPSRVLVQNGRYILLIRPADVAAAQSALQAANLGPPAEASTHGTFDPDSGRYSNCPACGSVLPEDFDGTCPECGLELSTPSEPAGEHGPE